MQGEVRRGRILRRQAPSYPPHQRGASQAAWLIAWLNLVKPFSERHDGGTPAMRLGYGARRYSLSELLERRVFPAHVQLPAEYRAYHDGQLRMPRFPREQRFEAKLAC